MNGVYICRACSYERRFREDAFLTQNSTTLLLLTPLFAWLIQKKEAYGYTTEWLCYWSITLIFFVLFSYSPYKVRMWTNVWQMMNAFTPIIYFKLLDPILLFQGPPFWRRFSSSCLRSSLVEFNACTLAWFSRCHARELETISLTSSFDVAMEFWSEKLRHAQRCKFSYIRKSHQKLHNQCASCYKLLFPSCCPSQDFHRWHQSCQSVITESQLPINSELLGPLALDKWKLQRSC